MLLSILLQLENEERLFEKCLVVVAQCSEHWQLKPGALGSMQLHFNFAGQT